MDISREGLALLASLTTLGIILALAQAIISYIRMKAAEECAYKAQKQYYESEQTAYFFNQRAAGFHARLMLSKSDNRKKTRLIATLVKALAHKNEGVQ